MMVVDMERGERVFVTYCSSTVLVICFIALIPVLSAAAFRTYVYVCMYIYIMYIYIYIYYVRIYICKYTILAHDIRPTPQSRRVSVSDSVFNHHLHECVLLATMTT